MVLNGHQHGTVEQVFPLDRHRARPGNPIGHADEVCWRSENLDTLKPPRTFHFFKWWGAQRMDVRFPPYWGGLMLAEKTADWVFSRTKFRERIVDATVYIADTYGPTVAPRSGPVQPNSEKQIAKNLDPLRARN